MSFDFALTGTRVLGPGGTQGIGAAIIQALREVGAQVVMTARANSNFENV